MTSTREQKQFISQYMQRRDVPTWYRGTSPFQIEAADQLSNAIRDDVEQNTTHRVRQCLVRLGLSPAVCGKDLKVIMRISGGNDLAFLWFLMELYYKTKGERYDSLNEQLILSSIAHLDMITTLRELDRILPPGHASKRQMELRQQQKVRQHKEKPRKLVKKRSSPYFDKLTRPRKFGKSLTLERPDYKVRFVRYDAYKDPNYVPPNEYSRWYDQHVFRQTERVTVTTLRSCITEIMKFIDFTPQPYAASSIIDFALNYQQDTPTANVMCAHHRMQEDERELRRMKFLINQRNNCEKSLELFAGKKKEHLQRIREMLDKEVEMYRLHYRKKNTREAGGQTCIRILGKNEYSEHCLKDDTNDNCLALAKCAATASTLTIKNFSQNLGRIQHSMDEVIVPKTNRLSFQESSSFNNFDTPYCNATTPASSQRYFIRPTEHKPQHFDYKKIFHFKDEKNKRQFIKEKCVEAMDKDPHVVPKAVDLTPDLGKVTTNCATEMWNKSEKKWRAEDKLKERELIVTPTDPYPVDMPRLPFYDCEDKELMDRMLKVALCEMKKQPKFVLASLPDAYKIPTLREWISQRYGKRYTHAQQLNELNMSIKVMNMLQTLKLKIKLPKVDAIGINLRQTYDCHKYIMKKINLHRRYFYNRLNAELLKRTRFFWFAMRSSLCLLPQRETFFAYMPSRLADNYLFKSWKTDEFMDAKAVYEHRRLEKAQKLLIQKC